LVRPFQGVDTFDRNVSNKIHKNLVTTRLHSTSKDKPGFQARIPMSECTKMIRPVPTNDIIVAAMNAKTDSSSRVATIPASGFLGRVVDLALYETKVLGSKPPPGGLSTNPRLTFVTFAPVSVHSPYISPY